ncbi:hypothetical protein ON010_g17037 [Phytophthora cinnamomi]|nr:hypothetical protein ON010_g17037 [Phytophthora cinnamomi]
MASVAAAGDLRGRRPQLGFCRAHRTCNEEGKRQTADARRSFFPISREPTQVAAFNHTPEAGGRILPDSSRMESGRNAHAHVMPGHVWVPDVENAAELAAVKALEAKELRSRGRPGTAIAQEDGQHVAVVEAHAGLAGRVLEPYHP